MPEPMGMPRRNPRVEAQAYGEAMVLYDPDAIRCHRLNAAARRVWEGCDGASTVPEVAKRLGTSRKVVHLALSQLSRLGLLELEGGVRRRTGRFVVPPEWLPRIDTVSLRRDRIGAGPLSFDFAAIP